MCTFPYLQHLKICYEEQSCELIPKTLSQTAVKYEKRGKGFAFLRPSAETCRAAVPCSSDFPAKYPLGTCLDQATVCGVGAAGSGYVPWASVVGPGHWDKGSSPRWRKETSRDLCQEKSRYQRWSPCYIFTSLPQNKVKCSLNERGQVLHTSRFRVENFCCSPTERIWGID